MRVSKRRVLAPFCGSLVSVAAAMVLAGICADAQAYGDKGVIELQVGGGGGQFAYNSTTSSLFQRFNAGSKTSCRLVWNTTDPELATLTASPAVDGDSTPGFGPSSIGVYDGPKGVPCYRVSKSANEKLTFALGSDTTSSGGVIKANAFDRLELDIEVKSDARLRLTMFVVGSVTRTYELRSGANVVPGVGLEYDVPSGAWPVSTPAARIVNCGARSDSGPDSGALDNCRWIIEDLGQSFTIEPLAGEFSLEGGGDWGSFANQNYTLIHLTSVLEGNLVCGGSTAKINSIGGQPGSCQVTSPPQSGQQACGIPYVFRDVGGSTNGCEFMKAPGGQLAAAMDITFPAEPRKELQDVNWPQTTVQFPDGYGGVVDFKPKLCTGTVGGTPINPTITEVLTLTPPPGYVDQVTVSPNLFKDWACILEQDVDYLGPLVDPKMRVRQVILFWGDPLITR